MIPVIIKNDNKMLYYKALHTTQTDKYYESLVRFFEQSRVEYWERIRDFIEEYVQLQDISMDTEIDEPTL